MGQGGGGSTWLLQECADPVVLKTARGLRHVPKLQAEANPAAWGPARTKVWPRLQPNLQDRGDSGGQRLLNHLLPPEATKHHSIDGGGEKAEATPG